jgi:hypothetical protein
MKIRFWSSRFKTKRASHRLRGDVMAQALRELGHDAVASRDLSDIDSDTVVVFLKMSNADHIQQARAKGAFTIYDLCDNKFDEKEEYVPCCLAADAITVNSDQMALAVKQNTGKDSHVIPDPGERPILEPRFAPTGDVKLLWFGSSASLKFVPWTTLWADLERHIKNYQFTMVTAKVDRLRNKMLERHRRGHSPGVNFDRIHMLEWDWQLQGTLLADTDMVVIPVVTENYRTDTKSANRVIDSLFSGRFVITTPLASYLEFGPYTWQQDTMQGIQWAMKNPQQAQQRVTQGQQYAIDNYSAGRVAQRFLETIDAIRKPGAR